MSGPEFAKPGFSEPITARSIFEHRDAYAAIKLHVALIPDEPEPLTRWRMRQIGAAIAYFDSGSYGLSVIHAARAMIPVSEIPPTELSRIIRDALDPMQAKLAMMRVSQYGF